MTTSNNATSHKAASHKDETTLTAGQAMFVGLPEPVQLLLQRFCLLNICLKDMIETGRLNAEKLPGGEFEWLKEQLHKFDTDLVAMGLAFPGENIKEAEDRAGRIWAGMMSRAVDSVAVRTTDKHYGVISGERDVVFAISAALLASKTIVDPMQRKGMTIDAEKARSIGAAWLREHDPEGSKKREDELKVQVDLALATLRNISARGA